MRLFEFTNAAEQLALLRTIIDNTWRAIEQQAQQQRQAANDTTAKTASKPRKGKGRSGRKSITPPRSRPALPPPPAQPVKNLQTNTQPMSPPQRNRIANIKPFGAKTQFSGADQAAASHR